MAAQVQQSTLAKRLGARLVQAHAQNKDKPVEFGGSRLPDGINDGVAQLVSCGFGEYKEGEMKGQPFFRAAGVMFEPKEVDGKQVAGKQTSIMVPLCDTPKRSKKKRFEDHYADFLNELKKLGVDMSKANAKDPSAVETYLNAAMTALTKAKPFFGVRTWKGKATKEYPNPLVNEEWEGLVNYNPNVDPAAAMTEQPVEPPTQPELQPEPFTEPPVGPPDEPADVGAAADEPQDLAEQLVMLAAIADEDVEGKTDEGVQAIEQLKALAAQAGISDEDVVEAPSYSAVAEMILAASAAAEEQNAVAGPEVGQSYSYRRRGPKGDPLLNAAKQPLPAVKVTVASVNAEAGTVTVKGPDGKALAGLDKKPVQVKFEWLEPLA